MKNALTPLTLVLALLLTGCAADTKSHPPEQELTAAQAATLPVAEVTAEYGAAPAASESFKYKVAWLKDGLAFTPAYDAPGGRPVALIAGGTRSDFKKTPVIDERPGWLKIMLPGKSSSESFMAGRTGAAGWVPDFRMHVKDQYLEVEVSANDRTAKVLYKGRLLSTHKLEESLREPKGITGRSGFVMQKVSEHLERCNVEESLTTSIPDGTTKLRDQITLTAAKPHPRESICRGGAEEAYRRNLGTFRVDDDALWRGVKPGTPIRFVE